MMSWLKSLLLWCACVFALLLVTNSVLPPISTLMIGRAFTLQSITRSYVPMRRISPNLVRAVIAAEDAKFCEHHGVDWKALHGAIEDAVDEDGRSRGASTLSMQVAKNLFLWPGRSYLRKTVEIPMALFLDATWSKRQMMRTYLNVAEFGRGIFGAEAAARHYFGKSASKLTLREASLLAGTLPNPKRRNPAHPSEYLSFYAGQIQTRAGGVVYSCTR